MKDIKHFLIPITALTVGLFLSVGAAAGAETSKPKEGSQAPHTAPASSAEQQRKDAKQEGEKAIDKDAVAALDEAQKAIKAISDGNTDQALAAIEQASGKINILTARKPAAALIPVKVEVAIVDLAPKDSRAVRDLSTAAQKALSNDDYPQARMLLERLASEIHVKTYNLPLATYPAAMQTAARLLDEKKSEEAKQALVTALNTLVVTDQALPLPLIEAQGAVKEAQGKRDKDKPAARKLLATAKDGLERAKTLGYANKDPEYTSLNQSIADLDKQLGGTESTASAFASLRDKIKAFFDRITEKSQAPSAQHVQN
jgi:hypothetical protein